MTSHEQRAAERVLKSYDPTLREMVVAGLHPDEIAAEGYSLFEATAVRLLLERTGYTARRAGGQTVEASPGQAGRPAP